MPETTDGKKFDYTKLGMMKAHMHQKRLDKNNKNMGAKVGSLGIVSGGVGAYIGHQYDIRKYDKMKTQVAQNLGMVKSGTQWKFPSEIKGSVPKASSGVPMMVDGKTVNLRPQDPRVVKAKADYAQDDKRMAEVRAKNNSNKTAKKPTKSGGGVGGFGKFSTINRASRSGSKLKLPPKDFL